MSSGISSSTRRATTSKREDTPSWVSGADAHAAMRATISWPCTTSVRMGTTSRRRMRRIHRFSVPHTNPPDRLRATISTSTWRTRSEYTLCVLIHVCTGDVHTHPGSYYNAYLKFFSDELLDKGAASVIEEFIFSPKANIEPPKPGKEPMQMAGRFLAGLFHPLIHAGYGCEFGLLGQLAEG